jgi:hypothetical protein
MPAANIDADGPSMSGGDEAPATGTMPRPEKDPKTGKVNRRKDGGVRQARGVAPKPKAAAPAADAAPERVTAGRVEVPLEAAAQAAAETMAETIRTVGSMLGGEEWDFHLVKVGDVTHDERAAFVAAWRGYFIATGAPNIPPWVGPIIVTGSYVGARLRMPKTRAAVVPLWERIKRAVTGIYLKLRGVV